MQLQEHKKVYVSNDEIFSFQDTLLDNISESIVSTFSIKSLLLALSLSLMISSVVSFNDSLSIMVS